MINKCFKKNNVIVGKYDLILYVDEISEEAVILGQTNTLLIEKNCILMNEDGILKDGLLRIEFKKYVFGMKIGYLEVGYNEYIVLKSVCKLWMSFVYIVLFVMIMIDIILYCR